jgi:hypothetical protein
MDCATESKFNRKLVVGLLIAGLERNFITKELWKNTLNHIVQPIRRDGGEVMTFICTEQTPPSVKYKDETLEVNKSLNVVNWVFTDGTRQENFRMHGQALRERILYDYLIMTERTRNICFTHVIRTRPDLLWFSPLSLTHLDNRKYHSRARKLLNCPARVLHRASLSFKNCASKVPITRHFDCPDGDSDCEFYKNGSKPILSPALCESIGFDGFQTCALLDDMFAVIPRVLSDVIYDPNRHNNVSTKSEIAQVYGPNDTMISHCRKMGIELDSNISTNVKEVWLMDKLVLSKRVPFEVNRFNFYLEKLFRGNMKDSITC